MEVVRKYEQSSIENQMEEATPASQPRQAPVSAISHDITFSVLTVPAIIYRVPDGLVWGHDPQSYEIGAMNYESDDLFKSNQKHHQTKKESNHMKFK